MVTMLIAGLVFAAVAALIHVFIFYLESVAWTTPRARAVFGTSQQEAEATTAETGTEEIDFEHAPGELPLGASRVD